MDDADIHEQHGSSTAKVLTDTNVWIAYSWRLNVPKQEQPRQRGVDRLIGEDRVVLSGIVEMELYQGLRKRRDLLEAQFTALEFFETDRADFRRAGHLLGTSKRQASPLARRADRRALLASRPDAARERRALRGISGLKRFPWRPS